MEEPKEGSASPLDLAQLKHYGMGPILQSSISSENFSDTLSSIN
jgi:hypothetical protein